jgi:NAD(P)H-dependent FMN reductase
MADKWAAKINEADAFIVVTPEYNHGTSAVLKNAFDWVYKEWNNKAVGFVGWGSTAGARAIENLRLIAGELQMADVRQGVHIPLFWTLLDEQGNLKPGALDPQLQPAGVMLDQLAAWGKAMKEVRQK